MIRIHLQPRRGRLIPYLLLGLGVFALGTMGLGYFTTGAHDALPGEVAVEEKPAVGQPVADAEPAPSSQPAGAGEVAPAPPSTALPDTEAEPLPPPVSNRSEAGLMPPVAEAPAEPAAPATAKAATRTQSQVPKAPAKEQAPVPGSGVPVCLRILQLHERLPAVVRCTSLSGTAGGEYTIEGTVPSADFPQLIALLDGLPRHPAPPALSGGMSGKKEGDYAFNLHGQFPVPAQKVPAALESVQAAGLFTQAVALARKSRLDSVRVGAPLFTPVGKGVVQQRQKLWATGSYPQLKTFVEALVRQQPQLRLEEVMLVPQYKGEAQWKQAQFYAVLSTAVRAAR